MQLMQYITADIYVHLLRELCLCNSSVGSACRPFTYILVKHGDRPWLPQPVDGQVPADSPLIHAPFQSGLPSDPDH